MRLSSNPYHSFSNFYHRGQLLYYVHGVLSLSEEVNTKKMSFQGDDEDERRTRDRLLAPKNKIISKSEQEKKKKELDALKRTRNAKKNELTGPYWKQKVDEIQFEDKTGWESNDCKSTDTN